jgi:periplasmic protein TonB
MSQAKPQTSYQQRRTRLRILSFALIICLHIGLLWAFLNQTTISPSANKEISVTIVPMEPPPPPPPKPIPPEVAEKVLRETPPAAQRTNVINDAPTVSVVETAEAKSDPVTETAVAAPNAQATEAAGQAGKGEGASGGGKGGNGSGTGNGDGRTAVKVRAIIDPERCEKPELSDELKRSHVSGSVILAMVVDVDGRIEKAQVLRPSGFPELDQTALGAIKRCKFIPATIDGDPVPSVELFRFSWTLNGS